MQEVTQFQALRSPVVHVCFFFQWDILALSIHYLQHLVAAHLNMQGVARVTFAFLQSPAQGYWFDSQTHQNHVENEASENLLFGLLLDTQLEVRVGCCQVTRLVSKVWGFVAEIFLDFAATGGLVVDHTGWLFAQLLNCDLAGHSKCQRRQYQQQHT